MMSPRPRGDGGTGVVFADAAAGQVVARLEDSETVHDITAFLLPVGPAHTAGPVKLRPWSARQLLSAAELLARVLHSERC